MMDPTNDRNQNETEDSRHRVLLLMTRIFAAENELLHRLIEDAAETYADLLELVGVVDVPEGGRRRLQAILVAGWERTVNGIFAKQDQEEENV